MLHVKFLSKFLSIYYREKTRFDGKNNHSSDNLANICLDISGKINCENLVVILYTSSRIRSRKI